MENEQQSQEQTKKCPKCAEIVQKEAKVCKHCGNKFVSTKRKSMGIGCLTLLILGIILINLSGGDSSSDSNLINKENNNSTKNELTTQDKVDQIVKKYIKPENLKSVAYSTETKTVKVEYNPHSKIGDTSYAMTDEASFVRGIYENLVVVGRDIFKIDGVEKFNIIAFMDTLDNYGKTNEIRGAEILFNKEEFAKYDWNSLKLMPVNKQIETSAMDYYVNPQLMKAIDPDKDLFLYFSK